MTALAFKEYFIKADGFTLRYMEAGSGSPLICIHGAGGLRVSEAQHLLAKKHRVLAFELPGFGASEPNLRSQSVLDLAKTMNMALEAMGLSSYSLWGNSFGARVVLNMALEEAEKVKAMILLAPAAIRATPRAHQGEPTPDQLYAHPERLGAIVPASPEVLEKQRQLLHRLKSPDRDVKLETRMAELTVPSLILFGTRDQIMPMENGRIYKELMPKSNLMLIYDAAHALDADRPEAVAEVVGDFLERQDSFIVSQADGVLHQ